jgi:hypothetical protein
MRAGRDRCGGSPILHFIPYHIAEGDELQTARLAIKSLLREIAFPNPGNCFPEPLMSQG